jgi:putative peptidoglycan lipid II flippase
VAFRIPNLLRRLFAEGSLSVAFIPVFTEYLTIKGKEDAFRLARCAIWFVSIVLAIVAVLGMFLSPVIIRIIAPGFISSPEKFHLTVSLTRIMFPYIFFIGLVALSMGILNSLGHFAAPALAPVFLNIAIICSVFFISPYMSDPVTGLAIGVLIGGVLQLALQIPFVIKKGLYFWKRTTILHPGLKKIGILMLPSVFGAAVYQINILVGTLLASLLAEGSISYLYYADRLVQFPLGIFAIATATAVLPSLSRQAAAKDFEAVKNTFAHAMKLVLFLAIPSMVGLFILREPIVALLFKRGVFDSRAAQLTAYALLYYSIGLWAFSGIRVVVSTFYALQDTKTPVRIAIISIIANILLGIILMGPLDHGGLALATSLASMLNFVLLTRALKIKLGSLGFGNIAGSVCKSLFCSAIMGTVVMFVAIFIIPLSDASLKSLFFSLTATIIIGILVYLVFSFLMKSPELKEVWEVIRVRTRKN